MYPANTGVLQSAEEDIFGQIRMKQQGYDLIGDIHGQHGRLTELLDRLGYRRQGETWRHPQGRKVVFLGDYIDRGPAIREVLHTVRGMVEGGDALAIMGNHEYNCICALTPDGRGDFLRTAKHNKDGQRATLAQFRDHPEEWNEWQLWMKRLPMFLDLGGFRAVHACWDVKRVSRLAGKSIEDADFLQACATRGTPEFRAVENVLKGPELAMPSGLVFHDKENTPRKSVRVRWWDIPEKARVSSLAMPEPFEADGDAESLQLRRIPRYGAHEPPVFFGHYWMPAAKVKAPLADNVACLDYSVAKGGPLVAYRWDGEQKLSPEKYVTTTF